VTLDDIYLGNGASELITMSTNALLDDGDELLLPCPTTRCGRRPPVSPAARRCTTVCDESNGWMPDLDDIRAKITPRTKGIVVINPNNPTGCFVLRRAAPEYCEPLPASMAWSFMADEVYDKVLYDGVKHTATGQPVD
jgi:alanine-synthesizing transaminase